MIEYADVSTDAKEIEEALGFVIGGGGLTGVEIATNIVEMLHTMRQAYPVLRQKRFRVVLVHAGPVLLPQLRPRFAKMADYAVGQVEKWGVEVKLNTKLIRVRDREAILSDGTSIPARTVISTIGQHPTVFPGTESLSHVANGLLETDEFLHVKGQNNIWAAGDSAQVMHVSGTPCPKTAIWAIVQGNCLGDNLARAIQNEPLKPFTFKAVATSACMGMGRAIAEYRGQQFTGWVAWFLRFFGYLYYVPSRRQALRMFADWYSLPFVGRYQTSLESVGEQLLFNKRNKEARATIEIPLISRDEIAKS
jgi:NADH dehydrogenase